MVPAEFSIAVHDLDAGGREFRLPVRAEWVRRALAGTEIAPGPNEGLLAVRASKSGRDVVVHGALRATVIVPCARCLGPAVIQVDENVSALAVVAGHDRGSRAPSGDSAEGTDDTDTVAYDGETVILDDRVRDDLLLAIPMIPLCSEGCPGIRPNH